MKKKNYFIYPVLLMIFISVFSSSCKKDEKDGGRKPPTTKAFTDVRDGNIYRYVTIGKQDWMAENLKYLPEVVGPNNSSVTNAYYFVHEYEGTDVAEAKDAANYQTYGVLYNWPAAMAGFTSSEANPSGVQGACPSGWHLPSDAEWTELIDYIGGSDLAGGKLKEAGTAHWNDWNDWNDSNEASNELGFTALPGGVCTGGSFYDIGFAGYWWVATEYNSDTAWHRFMSYHNSDVYRNYKNKSEGYSVRCIKN